MSNAIREGREVLKELAENWPDIHEAFGWVGDYDSFLIELAQDKWTILEYKDHYLFLLQMTENTVSGHWFIPYGAKAQHLRHLLNWVFTSGIADRIMGHIPSESDTAKLSRTLAIAMGFLYEGEVFVLTKERLGDYTRPNP